MLSNLIGQTSKHHDTGLTASELVKSVNVLNVITWVHSAVKSVKPQTVTKCFVKCGFNTPTQHSTQDSDDDESDDIPLARLIDQFRQARDLPEPITDPLEYASIDSDIPSSETLTEGWEQRLVDDFVPDRQPDSSHDTNLDYEDEEVEESQPPLSFSKAITMARTLKDFCSEHGLDIWQSAAQIEETLQEQNIKIKSQAKQTKIDSFFITKQ